jgi:hypothetical protein
LVTFGESDLRTPISSSLDLAFELGVICDGFRYGHWSDFAGIEMHEDFAGR